MIDRDALTDCLTSIGLREWQDKLLPLITARFSSSAHGDFDTWKSALDALARCNGSADESRASLLRLSPWRKGPFDVGGVTIDAEWRSDMKWARVADFLAPLNGRNVLDVGCGNGYYAFKMREAGANTVIGIEPTLLYAMQFLAVNHFINADSVFVLPLRLHELPADAGIFDTTFSMGVLYHQRSPIDHLRQLRDTLRPNGQLVLETLFVPGEESFACTPSERYARMKNVWLLPTVSELTTWLSRSGFRDLRVVDKTQTTSEEQRSTPWMTFESLAEALDPDDPSLSVEGWPAPRRIIITAMKP